MLSTWIGLLLLVAMVVAWVAVDAAWRRSVPAAGSPEALGKHRGCGGCQDGSCTNRCDDGAGRRLAGAGKEIR